MIDFYKKLLSFLLFFIFLPKFILQSQTISDIVNSTNASVSYVSNNNGLILQRGDIIINIPVNRKWIILNSTKKISIPQPVKFENGIHIIPNSSYNIIIKEFPSIGSPKNLISNISTIVIDAGHGGKDPGAINRTGVEYRNKPLAEKELTLDVALKLYKILKNKYPDINIVTTRNKDEFISLPKRSEIANQYIEDLNNNKVIFISIHANAELDDKAYGFEVWHLPKNYDRNLIDTNLINFDKGMSSVLNNLYEDQYNYDSELLSNSILKNLNKNLGKFTLNRGVREQNLSVTRNSKMPAVLVEIGFITSNMEAGLLIQDNYQNLIVDSMAKGIDEFIKVKK